MYRSEKGFTMIELLLVLMVAVLFVSTGLSITNATGRRDLYIAARSVQTLIRQSQDYAYGEGSIYCVGFYTSTNECEQIRQHEVMSEANIPRGIKINSTNFPEGRLFFTRQLTPSRGGSIYMSSRAHKVRITVLPVTGRVKIYPITKK